MSLANNNASTYNCADGGSSTRLGYNTTDIEALREDINAAAADAATGIAEILEQEIITPMSTAWYAPDAKSFFENVKTMVDAEAENLRLIFDTFRGNIEVAGKNWTQNTGNADPVLKEIDSVELSLNVSSILDSDNGSVYIIKENAESVANNLLEVRSAIVDRLASISSTLNASTAFIGGGQAEALSSLYNATVSCVDRIFNFLTEGTSDFPSLKDMINNFVKKYEDIAASNKSQAETMAENPIAEQE